MHLDRELKWEVGPEEYLEFVKGVPYRLFFNFVRVPMRCLRNWLGMLIRVGYRSVLTVGLVRNQLSMFCFSVVHMIPRDNFFDYLKQILPPEVSEAFCHSRTFDKAVLCLGGKQDTLVKDECNS